MEKSRKPEPVLWGVPRAARELDLDCKTIRKAMEAGQIPCVKIGRLLKIPGWWITTQRNGPGKAA